MEAKEFYEKLNPIDLGMQTKDSCIKLMSQYAAYIYSELPRCKYCNSLDIKESEDYDKKGRYFCVNCHGER